MFCQLHSNPSKFDLGHDVMFQVNVISLTRHWAFGHWGRSKVQCKKEWVILIGHETSLLN